MRELLEHIVKAIVNEQGKVTVTEKESVDFPGLIILTIDVAETDKGVVIGKSGRTINAIRDIITISAIRNNKKVRVMIKDDRKAEPEQFVETPVDQKIQTEKVDNEDVLNDEI